MAQLNKGTTYSPQNATVTIENLNAHVENASLLPGAISEQTSLGGAATPAVDQVLLLRNGALYKSTVVEALGNVTPSNLLNRNNNLSELTSAATAKTNLGIGNVENKSAATILSELTSGNITTALTYTPTSPSQLSAGLDSRIATSQIPSFVETSQISSFVATSQISSFVATSQLSSFVATSQISSFVSTSQLGAINGVATLGADQKLTPAQMGALTSASQLSAIGTQALAVIGAQPLLSFPLTTAQGGTGQSTYTAGEILIGNNSGSLTKATLTAGSNVSITSGSGTITVASTVPAATSAQIGGIRPGVGFSVSSGVLNGIMPKAIASFSGQYSDTIEVSGISWVRSAGSNDVLISKVGIIDDELIKVSHRIYINFTANSGSTAPAAQYVTVTAVTDPTGSFSATLSTPGTPPASGNWNGSCTFRKCLIHYDEDIDSIIYAGASAAAVYIVNLNKSFTFGRCMPSILPCGFQTSGGTGVANGSVGKVDFKSTGSIESRTSKSFFVTSVTTANALSELGYYSGVLVFGNY